MTNVADEISEQALEARRENGRGVGAENLRRMREAQRRDGRPPNFKTGLWPLVERGQLPPGAEQVVDRVDEIVGLMVSDMGGDSELTAQRRAILEGSRFSLTVLMLSGDYIRATGLTNAKGQPHPLLGIVNSFINTLRRNALALGLDRRARSVQTLESIVAEYAARPAPEPMPEQEQESQE